MKKVVICVPTFNSATTIVETLTSIQAQTYRHIEIKVFDNASTDQTVQLVKEIAARDLRIKFFSHDKNVGAEGNFNRCLAAADGDYTAIFHADDIYESDIVERQVAFLDTHPMSTAVATHAVLIDGHGGNKGERFLPSELQAQEVSEFDFPKLLQMVMQYANFITCPSVMARSHIYRDQICVWNGKDFGSSADLDVWFRLSQLGKFGFISRPLIRYRVSEASFTVRETKRRFTEHDFLRVLRNYADTNSAEYVFHEFKDRAARRLNILLAGRRDLLFPEFDKNLFKVLPLATHSFYQLKFIVVGLLIFAVTGAMKTLRLHR